MDFTINDVQHVGQFWELLKHNTENAEAMTLKIYHLDPNEVRNGFVV